MSGPTDGAVGGRRGAPSPAPRPPAARSPRPPGGIRASPAAITARPPPRGSAAAGPSGRDGTGRSSAPPGDAPPPPARPAPCGNRRRGYFCTWGERSGAGSVRSGHDWPRRAGPGPAPPHLSAPRRAASPGRCPRPPRRCPRAESSPRPSAPRFSRTALLSALGHRRAVLPHGEKSPR